ncbi:MAG TPA: putative DNA-binding domain-containing protein, partial [Gammaproteobacteria bacterium]|nr:putative DNA-binding domain-containing protein [Gammaproteobacteria bacterium]
MDKPLPNFQRVQYAFAAHLRDPQTHARPPGVEDRRMAIYRDLFYNNIEGFLSGGFPLVRSLYSDANWHRMARDFFAHHKSHTPYFPEISQEFLMYLQEERESQPEDPPFLTEIAHYEWVELALSVTEAQPDWAAIDPNG